MDILIPTRYDGPVPIGGSTKPWVVFALSSGDNELIEQPYVVKLFKPSVVKQHSCIAKEFICNLLAKEFDLQVPSSGIINLNSYEFVKTLNKYERKDLNQRFSGNTFASRYLNGTIITEHEKNLFTDIDDKAMVYAFDCLIQNVDRWGVHKKPNLIIHDQNFLLIDHELTLSFIDNNDNNTLKLMLDSIGSGLLMFNFQNHLFFNALKTYPGNKWRIFDTFHEYLINLNTTVLQHLIVELQNNFIEVGNINLLFDYVYAIKKSPGKFCEALVNSIL